MSNWASLYVSGMPCMSVQECVLMLATLQTMLEYSSVQPEGWASVLTQLKALKWALHLL